MKSAQEVAEVIALEAKKSGLSLNKLLLESGCTGSMLRMMRDRGSMPSADRLSKIAARLGVTTEYLLGVDEQWNGDGHPIIPEVLRGVRVAFDRGEFEGLTQEEVDALAVVAEKLKAARRL